MPKDQQDGQSSSKQQKSDQAGQTNNRHSREVTVESVVRLDDKPELFKNLAGKNMKRLHCAMEKCAQLRVRSHI